MTELFWLNDDQWDLLDACLPHGQAGARRVDDRRVVSGIIYVLSTGCAWGDCPPDYGPPMTVYNRWRRWSRRLVWYHALSRLDEATGDQDHGLRDILRQLHQPPHRRRGRRANGSEVKRMMLVCSSVMARQEAARLGG